MNLEELSEKLNKIDDSLKNDKSYETLLKNLKDYDPRVKNEYYDSLEYSERDYQKRNDEYKRLVEGFSQAYLDFCEWYVGPELPRETFLDDKDSINSLYFLFIMSMFLKSNIY
tara:strand:+ start:140 stop:478 length:339 start_codon:yes stop_codon:yes gene_type:complete